MADIKIVVCFYGTGYDVDDEDGEKVTIRNKKYSNIRRKKDYYSGDLVYSFSGSNAFDLGSTNIANNIKNAVMLLSDEIDKWVFENRDNDDTIQINILGHSRGGATATRVAQKLRNMYQKNKKVKINFRVSDPYAGPTHRGKNVSIDVKPNKTTFDAEGSEGAVFYSMGTAFHCSPQKIMNAKTVFICQAGHNGTAYYLIHTKNNKEGVYLLWRKGKKIISKEVTKDNLKEVMDEIYNWEKSYSARTRVLTEVIVKKLNLKIDDVLETGAVREWGPAFKKTLGKIKKSLFLKTAFNYVFELFSDKLFGPYINKKGEFFRHIENAKSAVAGIGNNDYEEAINQLDMVIDGSKQLYKAELALALKERIMRYYNLDKK